MRVNMTDVEVSNFDPIPGNTYLANITDGEVKTSGPQAKNPGAEYVNFEFTISEGEYEGRKQWKVASLLPHALFSLKEVLSASGVYSDEQLTGELEWEIDDVIGKPVRITVTKERVPNTEPAEFRNNVKKVRKVGDEDSSEDGSLLP